MDDEEFIPTRKSLLSRLKNWDDNASWRDFFDTYWKLIYGVALKAGLTHTEAQDVVQETVLGVAKSIGQFKYDPAVCSFKSWLMQVTRHRIANQFERRKRHPLPPETPLDHASETPLLERVPDPAASALEAIWDEEWEKNLMDAAIRKVKHRVHRAIPDVRFLRAEMAVQSGENARCHDRPCAAKHRVSGWSKRSGLSRKRD
jgi:RNA polymerase sigma-70 factor (ECF subfamily)